jgi:preprotein translocase subunit YajC
VLVIAAESGGSALGSLPFLLVLFVGMYLLLIRPQRMRARQLAAVRSRLAPGSRVVTTAGLHAAVVEVGEDDTVLLEIAPGVHARFASQAVVQVLEEPAAEQAGPEDGH